MKRVYAVDKYCIACRLCEVACLTEHSASKNMIVAMRHENPKPKAMIRVQEVGPLSFALQCRHCSEPLCAYSCLTQALQLTPTGVVAHNPDYCIACYTCILACPYGAITRKTIAETKTVAKCDLCTHREIPACVEICPNEALVFGEQGEYEIEYGGTVG